MRLNRRSFRTHIRASGVSTACNRCASAATCGLQPTTPAPLARAAPFPTPAAPARTAARHYRRAATQNGTAHAEKCAQALRVDPEVPNLERFPGGGETTRHAPLRRGRRPREAAPGMRAGPVRNAPESGAHPGPAPAATPPPVTGLLLPRRLCRRRWVLDLHRHFDGFFFDIDAFLHRIEPFLEP